MEPSGDILKATSDQTLVKLTDVPLGVVTDAVVQAPSRMTDSKTSIFITYLRSFYDTL